MIETGIPAFAASTDAVFASGQLVGRVAIGGVDLDLADVTAAVTIRFGRLDPAEPPIAATITLELLDLATVPDVNCGDDLDLDLIDGSPRFRGQITDLAQSWGDGGRLAVTGAGNLARIARRTIGYGDWPQEAWSARVARVMAEADWTAYTVQTGLTDPLVAARLASATTVANELTLLAATTSAAICDLPDGSILVQAIGARQAISAPVLVLPPELVLYAPDWTQTLDVVNVVDVAFGTLADSHTQTSRNADSVERYGERSGSVASTFALEADATAFGAEIVGRRGYPHWLVPAVQLAALVTPTIGALVLLAELPAGSPLGAVWEPVCEGWTDTLTGDAWLTMLQVSDPVRSGMSIPWRNVPAWLTWDGVSPTCSWAEAVDLPHLLGEGS